MGWVLSILFVFASDKQKFALVNIFSLWVNLVFTETHYSPCNCVYIHCKKFKEELGHIMEWKLSISRYSVMWTIWEGVDCCRDIYGQLRDLEPQVGWNNRSLVIHDRQRLRKHGLQHREYLHGYLLLLLFAWPATFKNLVISKSLQLVASVTSTAFFFFHLWHNKKNVLKYWLVYLLRSRFLCYYVDPKHQRQMSVIW